MLPLIEWYWRLQILREHTLQRMSHHHEVENVSRITLCCLFNSIPELNAVAVQKVDWLELFNLRWPNDMIHMVGFFVLLNRTCNLIIVFTAECRQSMGKSGPARFGHVCKCDQ